MPSDKGTGLVFAAVAAIVAALLFYANEYIITNGVLIAASISLVFASLAQFASPLLRPLNRVWFKFSLLLFKIVNPIIMFILYAMVIVPYGLIMQQLRDPLRAKKDPNTHSYWIEKAAEESTRPMKNQF